MALYCDTMTHKHCCRPSTSTSVNAIVNGGIIQEWMKEQRGQDSDQANKFPRALFYQGFSSFDETMDNPQTRETQRIYRQCSVALYDRTVSEFPLSI